MKRVCFIGSSHVGCMKLGVEALGAAGRLGGIDVTVFGTSGDKLRFATVEDRHVRPNNKQVQKEFEWTSGGRADIPLAAFDEIYLFAGLPPTCIDSFFVHNRVSGEFDVPAMSDQIIARVFASLRASWYIRLAESMAEENPQARVTFVGRPFRSDAAPAAKRMLKKLNKFDRSLARRVDRVKQAMATYTADSGRDNFTFAWPLPTLLEKHGLFTQSTFARGSVRLSDERLEHPADDHFHMNAAYGETMASHLLGLTA